MAAVTALSTAIHKSGGLKVADQLPEFSWHRLLFYTTSNASSAAAATRLDQSTRNTFITSSPRWLMTFTAMRPDFGLGNGREVSLWSVAHASSLTSAFNVVFRALYGSLAPRK